MPTKPKPVGRWDIIAQKWVEPFQDTESLLAAGGDPGATPVEECVHSWFRVSGADRYRCAHCGVVWLFSSEP